VGLYLELSPAFEEEARRLLREEDLEARATWCLHDIAADPDAINLADVVVLHRVVCCYPDYRRLLGAAAGPRAPNGGCSATRRAAQSRACSSPGRTSSFSSY
jgi:hypothetical protein